MCPWLTLRSFTAFAEARLARIRRQGKSVLGNFRVAERIAWSPLTFQAVLSARDLGLLAALERAGHAGLLPAEAAEAAGLSLYATRVLLEACMIVEVTELDGKRYRLASAGFILTNDPVTRANMDFVQDVCYQGAFHLKETLQKGRPAGLAVFGPWKTIYEGLTQLPEKVQRSWFGFDHAYSSAAFPDALPIVFSGRPKRLLDVGGNTGKWALSCVTHDPEVHVCIVDHPGQLELARKTMLAAQCTGRVEFTPMDLLDHSLSFPEGHDAVWMSQFLDCFNEGDITRLLERGRKALSDGGTLYIMETFWDRQPHDVARDVVVASSIYFACMANGDSRMYHSDDLRPCLESAGLELVCEHQLNLHTLWACQARA